MWWGCVYRGRLGRACWGLEWPGNSRARTLLAEARAHAKALRPVSGHEEGVCVLPCWVRETYRHGNTPRPLDCPPPLPERTPLSRSLELRDFLTSRACRSHPVLATAVWPGPQSLRSSLSLLAALCEFPRWRLSRVGLEELGARAQALHGGCRCSPLGRGLGMGTSMAPGFPGSSHGESPCESCARPRPVQCLSSSLPGTAGTSSPGVGHQLPVPF